MSDRLDWEKARKREIVLKRGADRAPVTRFRAGAAASDADVQRLVSLGYSGKRPESAAEVRELIKRWAPTELGVTRRDIEEVRSAKESMRRGAAVALAEKLARGYSARLAAIAGSTQKMKPSTKVRLRRDATRAYEILAAELHAIALGAPSISLKGESRSPRRVRRGPSRIGPTQQELATLHALPLDRRQPRAELLWKRVELAYESRCKAARDSGSTRTRRTRLRALFIEREGAKREIFGDADLTASD